VHGADEVEASVAVQVAGPGAVRDGAFQEVGFASLLLAIGGSRAAVGCAASVYGIVSNRHLVMKLLGICGHTIEAEPRDILAPSGKLA
jgi:hypothetical protein